jgi:hypothetical protein
MILFSREIFQAKIVCINFFNLQESIVKATILPLNNTNIFQSQELAIPIHLIVIPYLFNIDLLSLMDCILLCIVIILAYITVNITVIGMRNL